MIIRSFFIFKGGYTSTEVSIKPEENKKSQYWGTINITPGRNPDLSGKSAQIGSFACANGIKIGNEILVSCGTKPMWSIITARVPKVQACESPQCLILPTSQLESSPVNWIRQFFIFFFFLAINMFVEHSAIYSANDTSAGVMDVANDGFT